MHYRNYGVVLTLEILKPFSKNAKMGYTILYKKFGYV